MVWVATGIAIVGGISSIGGGIAGKDAADKAGEQQAKLIMQTEAENQRRRQLALGQQLGGITAAVAASNLQMSGSSQRYRNSYESNYRSEMAWDRQKARLDAELAKDTGQAVGQSAMYSGITSSLGSFASAAGGIMAQSNANPNGSSPFYLGKKPGPG